MKVVQRAEKDMFRFTCNKCGCTLEANGNEFEFVKKGHLRCTCTSCKEQIIVKESKIKNVPFYKEIKPNVKSEKEKA